MLGIEAAKAAMTYSICKAAKRGDRMAMIRSGSLKKVSFMILLSIVLLIISGCSQTKAPYLGEWQSNITDEITIRIKEDGRLEEYWDNNLTAIYTYEVEGNSLIVEQYDDKYTLLLDRDKLVYGDEPLYTKK